MGEVKFEVERKREQVEALLKSDWRKLPHALIIFEPATSRYYYTGDWRTFKPVRNKNKCITCLLCWVYCPEGCIYITDDGGIDVNLNYCKGCGVCAKECPVGAIDMEEEK